VSNVSGLTAEHFFPRLQTSKFPALNFMSIIKNKGVFASLLLSLTVTFYILLMWEVAISIIAQLQNSLPFYKLTGGWWQFSLLIGYGLFLGFLAEKFSVKRLLNFLIPLVICWGIASFIAAQFFSVNLFFLRVTLITLLTALAVHLKKLWLIDSELTDKLVELASESHLLEIRSADVRIESSLKLLEKIFPLSEAIVFRFDDEGGLMPVGRARNETSDSLSARQNSWREGISFCEKALELNKTLVNSENNTAQVALPLIYDGVTVGVLFVKMFQNFDFADQYLLESLCEQIARNFQRKELREKHLPNKFWWSFLSTQSAENRVGTTSLIKSLMKEQSFSALASSYLKESHAIAYLDGTLAYLNRQMRHLANLSSGQVIELDLFELLDNFKTDLFNEPTLAIKKVLQTGDKFSGELYYAETNKTLDLQISLVKVPNDDASIHETNVPMKPACFLVTIRDISEKKENERLRSDMASLMSHELRTPITSIQGFTELILADENIAEDSREFLEIIHSETQRLSKMLTTFLSVSNLEQSDKKEINKTPVKLDTVVSDAVNDLQTAAKRKRIRLIEQVNTPIPPIAADKGLIQRAVTHLIDNAIRYSPEKTSVIISTVLEADFLRVVIEDRGYGIPTAEKEKIWQKFYRVAREGQDKEGESTGLGLSLVKEIVEQHDGEVAVESEIGQGSKFSLKLPRL
jgi:signal transduction histidine kinase